MRIRRTAVVRDRIRSSSRINAYPRYEVCRERSRDITAPEDLFWTGISNACLPPLLNQRRLKDPGADVDSVHYGRVQASDGEVSTEGLG